MKTITRNGISLPYVKCLDDAYVEPSRVERECLGDALRRITPPPVVSKRLNRDGKVIVVQFAARSYAEKKMRSVRAKRVAAKSHGPQYQWSEEAENKALELAREGFSRSIIAATLNEMFPQPVQLTKNSVCGKLDRLRQLMAHQQKQAEA